MNERIIVKKCSAKDCVSSSIPCPVASMFKFPRDLNRCAVWVKNSGNQKLLDTPSRRLCVRRYLCVNHFEENQFFDKFRRRLRRNAIPTIFSSTPLSDELMSKFPVLEDPLNPDNEKCHFNFNNLSNKYTSFPLPCSRGLNKSDSSKTMLPIFHSIKSKQANSLASCTEVIPCISQDNSIELGSEEPGDTKISIPSCESSINSTNLMPGPGSITYIEGPWSKQPDVEVDQSISVEIFNNPEELLIDGRHVEYSGSGSQYHEIIVHHVDIKSDENYDNLTGETLMMPTNIPTRCDFEMNSVQCSEFPILDPNPISSDIETILPSSPSPATERQFVIQSKQLTNGGQVRVTYGIPDDILKH